MREGLSQCRHRMRGPGKLFAWLYQIFFFVGVETDEGIREDLARSVSSAWIGLHPKQTEAGTQANSIEGEVSSLMKGCEVSGVIMVQLQVFVPHL